LSSQPAGQRIAGELLVLGFAVTNGRPVLTMLTPVNDPQLKQPIVAGNLAQACNLSGKPPDIPGDCTRAVFSALSGSPEATGSVLGVGVRTWKVDAPEALPGDVALFIEKGCWGCEGYPTGLERVYRDAAGTVHTDKVFDGGFSGVAFSADMSEAYATVCIAVCGPLGPSVAGTRTTIYHSVDGGVTWTAGETVDGFANVLLDGSHGWVLYQSIFDGTNTTSRFSRYPGGAAITAPTSSKGAITVPGGALLFYSPTFTTLATADGSPLVEDLATQLGDEIDQTYGVTPVAVLPSGDIVVRWQHPTEHYEGRTAEPRVGLVRAGKLVDVIGGPNVDIGALMADGRIFGNADLIASDLPGAAPTAPNTYVSPHLPALIDLAKGEVTPLLLYGPDLFGGAYYGRNIVVAAALGPFAKVHTGGDCLNVRETASTTATSLGCFADGVLLRVQSIGDQTVGGVHWVPVTTPDGRPGWASAEFLQR
ncbi:MAG TPA: SH3 domain-containing protein, partial [Tepidiformaceae bacterium]|nr:SH3 domain-containing protein [Tepidiformaceae bacterium]